MNEQRLRIFDPIEPDDLPTPDIGGHHYWELVAAHPGRLIVYSPRSTGIREDGTFLVVPGRPLNANEFGQEGRLIQIGHGKWNARTKRLGTSIIWHTPSLDYWSFPDDFFRLLAVPVPPEVRAGIDPGWLCL